MALTCSLLGHRYGDRERTEEREQEGDEIVVTIRDVKICERCGDTRVVSESKEVTAAPPRIEEETEPSTAPPTEPTPPEVDSTSPPEEEDAEILETADGEAEERGSGEWPEEDEPATEPEDTEKEPEDWPEVDTEADEGYDARSVSAEQQVEPDDEVITAAIEEDVVEGEGEETEAGFFRADAIQSPADPAESTVLSEYYCPRCSWTRESAEASVRAGDICPSCHTGYLAERDPR